MQNCSLHGWSQRSTGEEVVVRLRAKMRTGFPLNLSITFYCPRYRRRLRNIPRCLFFVFSLEDVRLLISWFRRWLMGCCPELWYCEGLQRTAIKSNVSAAQLRLGEEKVPPVKMEWNGRTVFRPIGQVERRCSLKRVSLLSNATESPATREHGSYRIKPS